MLKHIQVTPLAGESLGTRSMCTYVETPDVRILLDAGVSLCPNRFKLPPHPLEFKVIDESRKRIAEYAKKAEVVTISHYHFDHHTPSFEDWLCNWTARNETAQQVYDGKMVLAKNSSEKINSSQRRRAWLFQKTGGKHAKKLEIADGKTFAFEDSTKLRFSEPVFHGAEGSELGWVLIATVEFYNERFVYAPDVQGPMSLEATKRILAEFPDLLMIGGPPTYLVDFKTSTNQIRFAFENLEKIVQKVPCVIVDHHLLRDEGWRKKAGSVFEAAKKAKHSVLTAAEFVGKENLLLEALRKKLYVENKPQKEFEKWMRKSDDAKRFFKPPIDG
jgi:predicted metallo-beta-lactamase superfamily hydrolase